MSRITTPIEKYAMLLEKVFDIEGVMALAWYTLHAHRLWLKEKFFSLRVPMLIIEGLSGTGKTELARAVAAIDVQEGLNVNAAIHCLPTVTSGTVRALVDGNASLVILESLRNGVANKSIKAIMQRKEDGPLVMMTSADDNSNSMLSDECIFVRLPQRRFTPRDRELLDKLHKEMRNAYSLRYLLFQQPSSYMEHNISAWRERLTEEIRKMGLIENAPRSRELINYYALIIGHWQGMQFSGADMLNRLARYAMRSLSLRLPEKEQLKRNVLQLRQDTGDAVTLTWHQPDGHRQRIRFANEQLYKGFVAMLRMMDETNAQSVEVGVIE